MNGTYKIMRTIAIVFALVIAIQPLCAQVANEDSGILKKADSFREYSPNGFSFDFELTDDEGERSIMKIFLHATDRDMSIARYKEPKKYSRRVVLALKNTFYIYDEGMRSPIRVTPREMLFGQAAAGDIARIGFDGMYSLEATEASGENSVLRLKAIKGKGATYDLVELTIRSEDNRPVRALCKGASGKLMKTIEYERYDLVDGKTLLTGFSIIDEGSKKTSRILLSNFRGETLPDSSFSVNALQNAR